MFHIDRVSLSSMLNSINWASFLLQKVLCTHILEWQSCRQMLEICGLSCHLAGIIVNDSALILQIILSNLPLIIRSSACFSGLPCKTGGVLVTDDLLQCFIYRRVVNVQVNLDLTRLCLGYLTLVASHIVVIDDHWSSHMRVISTFLYLTHLELWHYQRSPTDRN